MISGFRGVLSGSRSGAAGLGAKTRCKITCVKSQLHHSRMHPTTHYVFQARASFSASVEHRQTESSTHDHTSTSLDYPKLDELLQAQDFCVNSVTSYYNDVRHSISIADDIRFLHHCAKEKKQCILSLRDPFCSSLEQKKEQIPEVCVSQFLESASMFSMLPEAMTASEKMDLVSAYLNLLGRAEDTKSATENDIKHLLSAVVHPDHFEKIRPFVRNSDASCWSPSKVTVCLYALQSAGVESVLAHHGKLTGVSGLLDDIADRIESVKERFTPSELAKCAYGLRLVGSERGAVKILETITSHVMAMTETFSSRDIAHVMAGIEKVSDSRCQVELGKALQKKISKAKDANFTVEELEMCFMGMRTYNVGINLTRTILSCAGTSIENMESPMPVKSIARLASLLSYKSAHPKSLKVVRGLTTQLLNTTEEVSAQSVCKVLAGLRCMSSNHDDVRNMLKALIIRVNDKRESQESSSSQTVSEMSEEALKDAFEGIRMMNLEDLEVQRVLFFLRSQLLQHETLKTETVSDVLSYLQLMDQDNELIQNIATNLVQKARLRQARLTVEELPIVMYGMRSMDSGNPQVRAVVDVLVPLIRDYEGSFAPHRLQVILGSMQNMTASHEHVAKLLDALCPHIINLQTATPLNDEVFLMLSGMHGLFENRKKFDRNMLAALIKAAKASDRPTSAALFRALHALQEAMGKDSEPWKQLSQLVFQTLSHIGKTESVITDKASILSAINILHQYPLDHNSKRRVLKALIPYVQKSLTLSSEEMLEFISSVDRLGLEKEGTKKFCATLEACTTSGYSQGEGRENEDDDRGNSDMQQPVVSDEVTTTVCSRRIEDTGT